MQAVEFEADIQNGKILLPEEFQRMKTGHLRVIALFQDNPGDTEAPQSLTAEALDFPNSTGGFALDWESSKLTRGQLNER